eukprot:TRINITY_DN1948_c0_g1_i1.p1 TRINITY_DN1948_c0_g1~~TRINITY_DN1948_c0_g1_i1.p1  ORF type:complete len:315 (+),score=73.59 TRINITY_DN1948_c0_g1_i1:116-1060(+)
MDKYTVKDVIERNQIVHLIDKQAPLSQAFHTLVKNNIYSAPVYDRNANQFIGFLDLLDVVTFIVGEFDKSERKNKKRSADGSVKSTASISSFFDGHIESEPVSRVADLSRSNSFISILPDTPFMEVLEIFATTGAHRVAIADPISAVPKTDNILTQSRVIQFLSDHLELLGDLGEKTVKELNLGMKMVICVSSEETALEAFKLMAQHKISSVAITEEGKVIANLSAKDIKLVQSDAPISTMYKTTVEFVSKVHSTESNTSAPVIYCKSNDTLSKVITHLAHSKRHRLYIVDDEKRPLGVITLGDIVRKIIEWSD